MNNFNFNFDDTKDEDFFSSLKGSKSSKLQELFVEDALIPDDKQQSLKYQRTKDIATSSNATRTTLMAKVVTAYKEGELQGKVGLAVIQNPDKSCNLVIYKTKTQILATLKLQAKEGLLYKHANYWQFYDEASTYWSFSFDSIVDEEEFVDNLCANNCTYKENHKEDQVEKKNIELSNSNEAQEIVAVKDFTGKISEDATKETKISLIKRMARMGKPLPTLSSSNQQTTTEFSDSSDPEVIETPLASSQKPFLASRSNKIASSKVIQQLVPSSIAFNSTTGSAVYPLNPLESQYMQMLFTEQRTQASEFRMNMNKLENKIEKVLDKLEFCDRNDGKQKAEKEDEILELEEKLIALKKENRKLRKDVQECSSKESEENKIKDILYDFKEDLKHLNIDYMQDLKNVLAELNYKIKESHNKLKETQNKQNENELKLKEVKMELELATSKNADLQKEVNLLKRQENELNIQLNKKETENITQKEKILDLEYKLLQKKQQAPYDALVKSIMNNLYLDIADKLSSTSLSHSEKILSLIASSIKQQTLQSLQ